MFVFAVSGRQQEMSNPNVGGSKNSKKRQIRLEVSENEVCVHHTMQHFLEKRTGQGTG